MTLLKKFVFGFFVLASVGLGQEQTPTAGTTAEQNKPVILAKLLNAYPEDQLLFALLAASPFSRERSATDLALIMKGLPVEQRNELKRDWFVFLLGRFTITEIEQMHQWQLQSPQSQSLVLKLAAQVAVSDPEMLGKMMGLVPNGALQ